MDRATFFPSFVGLALKSGMILSLECMFKNVLAKVQRMNNAQFREHFDETKESIDLYSRYMVNISFANKSWESTNTRDRLVDGYIR